MRRQLILMLLVAAVAAPAAHADDEPFKKWWPKAKRQFLKARTTGDKVAVIRSFSKRKAEEAGYVLAKFGLYQKSLEVRMAAAQELADPKHKKWVPDLLKAMKSAKDALPLEIEIVDTLGAIGDASAVEPLMEHVRRPHLVVVRRILMALGKIKDPTSVKDLVRFLEEVFPPKQARDAGEGSAGHDWRRHKELERPFLDTMQTLTGERFDIAEDWRAWFNDNKKKFEKK